MSGKPIEQNKKKKKEEKIAILTPWNPRENLCIVKIYLLDNVF